MPAKNIKYLLTFLILAIPAIAFSQQPLLKFKPNPDRTDSFDLILSTPPLKLISLRVSLALEMRLKKNFTFKITPGYINVSEPYFLDIQNLEISDFSFVQHFDEQSLLAMVKHYKTGRNSRVYFGPYLGFGIEARRANIRMETLVPNFENAVFDFSTKRKSLIFAIGTTKLFSKRIIFDFYAAVKYQYKVTNKGNFNIEGIGYKQGLGGAFGFSVGVPLGKRKF